MKSFFFFFFLFFSLNVFSADYYWIGGSGSWSDINHWATTSGGTINHLQVPTPFDDVFFDANSFTAANQVVTIDGVNSVCRDMNWTGTGFTPTFTGSYDFRIYGSLVLIPVMNWNYYGSLLFESTSPGKTITSAGKTLFSGISFHGIGGGWTLTDALNISAPLYLTSGSLNTNNQPVNCTQLYTNSGNQRSLILGSSIMTINAPFNSPGFMINSTNLTLNAGTSVIKIYYNTDTCLIFGNQPLLFHNLELINNSSNCTIISVLGADYLDIRSTTNINKLTLTGQSICILNNGLTEAVNVHIDSLIVNDECYKSIENKNNYRINTLQCNPNTNFTLNVDQNDTIQDVFFNGESGTINGNNAKFNQVMYSGNGNINGNNSFDTLSFAPGKIYHLSSGNTQNINSSFTANGNCSGSVIIYSSSNGIQANINKTSGDVTVNYVILRDMNASGGANFVANNAVDLGNNTGWTMNTILPLNLFWVGSTGNWNDPIHWSLTSGGPGGTCVPSSLDNVYFDANSFSATGQVVTINAGNAFCKDMDWTGALNSPELSGSISNNLRIYGSLKLIPGMNFTFLGQVMFESTSLGRTITTGGNSLNNNVYFQGVGGGWTFVDAFTTSGSLLLITGNLNSNSQLVNCSQFNSANANVRTFVLGSSIFTVNAPFNTPGFTIQTTNLTFDPGTSLIKVFYSADTCLIFGNQPLLLYNLELINSSMSCSNYGIGPDFFDIRAKTSIHKLSLSGQDIRIVNSGSSPMVNVNIDSLIVNDQCNKSLENKNNYSINTILCNPNTGFSIFADQNDTIKTVYFNGTMGAIYGSNAKFQKVLYSGDGQIGWSNTFDTLAFAAGHTYYLTDTQTINNSFIADGTCSARIAMFSIPAGTQASIFKSSGNVTVNYVILKDMNATGGAIFVANNSVDLGNNTGWIINSTNPLNLFWVNGTGNWNDPNHWSLTSGGQGGACIPSPYDNVFFDANSFSSLNQIVTLTSGDFFCNNMDWTGVTNFPTFSGNGSELYIYGSLKFIPEMTVSTIGSLLFEATSLGKTITSGGNSLHCSINFQGIGGGWTLNDALSNSAGIFFWSGTLNTNNQPVNCDEFYSSSNNQKSLIFGSSVLTINARNNWTGLTINSTNLTFDAGNSVFRIYYSNGSCKISGNQPIIFHDIELTNNSPNCSNIPVLGADYFNIQTATNINKLTLSGQHIQLQNNGLSDAVNVHIDSLIVNDLCQKIIENKNNYKINTILCNPNTFFRIFVDLSDTIQDIFFNGNQGIISGSSKFKKVIFSSNGFIEGTNVFDTLSFSPGRYYLLQSGTTQTINGHLSLRGNGCFPITLQSNQSGLQSIISKTSGIVSADYVEMRDQNAIGGAQFYAGNYSSNVSNNTGWIFSNAPNYSYGLGPDTSFCQGDTLLLSTINFNGGISWLWQDGTTNSYYKVTQPGTYWVKVTYSNDCFYSDTIHVTQKPKPVAVATSNIPVCSGDTLKLYGTGGASYSWTGPFGFLSTLQNPQIINSSPANAGNYILSTTQNGCTGSPDTTVVQIDATFSPSISISASANPVYAGTSVTFTATPTNGGSTPLYQWIVNGINVGTSIPTYTYVPENGDLVECVLTSNLSCAINNPVTSNQITMIVLSGTPCPGIPTVIYDGQTYNTVQIGTQCWFRENLNIGTRINGSSDQTNNAVIEKYCYDDLDSNCDVYGGLYQWNELMQYSTVEGAQGICPTGWNIPTDGEWTILTDFLGGGSVAGGKMKEAGYTHWAAPNTGATNSSGFTALPGGYRYPNGDFGALAYYALFWSSSQYDATDAWYRGIYFNGEHVASDYSYETRGFSGRCLKDSCTSYYEVSVSINPSANPICNGNAVTFTAIPTNGGTAPFYQWKVNGNSVGTNSATYSYTPVNNDIVTCVLTSNAFCTTGNPATSNAITMTVYSILPVSVSIAATENPVCAGTSVIFTATPTNGGSSPSYQWKVNGNSVGTNSATYSYTPVNNDIVTCVLTSNASCATGNPATSDAITMTVNSTLPVSVSIAATENPVCAGNSVTFTATPTNGGTLPAYQWKVNGSNVGTNSPTYAYTPVNSDAITCVLTSNETCATGSPATSNAITMTVNSTLPVSVSIAATENPVCAGTSVTYTATPTNGGTLPAYQWKVNGNSVGTNSATYSNTPVNGDLVTCVLTSNATCATGNPATSDAITMTVNATLPVSVSITATENPVCAGTSVTYSATPINGGTLPAYQWKVNGSNVGTNIPTYSYTPFNGDIITCVLTSNAPCASGNPATSIPITMAVNANLLVSVSITATENPVCAGTSVTFTAIPTNGGTLPAYQWKVNGLNVGTNSSTFTYTPANNDQVQCILTSNITCPTGNPAISNTINIMVITAPVVSLNICNNITTRGAQPFVLKGGIPLGGSYSGQGVIGNTFYPALVPIGQTIVPITYNYSNSYGCPGSAIQNITVLQESPFTCGQQLIDVRDNSIYPTILIGTQCWMAKSLNFGNSISSYMMQNDNCIVEKYCYNDNILKCDSLGGLYQWDELMQYSENSLFQGLCPPGWHIPDENEWSLLFNNFGGNAFAGDALRYSGPSGFNALLAGAYFGNRQFEFKNFSVFFWSSTSRGNYKAWSHAINTINHGVSYYPSLRNNAFSVRCLKDQ